MVFSTMKHKNAAGKTIYNVIIPPLDSCHDQVMTFKKQCSFEIFSIKNGSFSFALFL